MNRWMCAGLVLATIGISGCLRVPRDPIEIRRYAIDAPAPPERYAVPLDMTLFVPAFQVTDRQRGERIMYRDARHAMNIYFYHRWIVSPEKMLRDVLADHLLAWGIVGDRVLRSEMGIVPTHEIHGRLLGLWADNSARPYTARFEAGITVLKIMPRTFRKEIVFQRTYLLERPRDDERVESFVVAVNAAVGDWLAMVRQDVEIVLRSEAAGPAAGGDSLLAPQGAPPGEE